MVTQTSKVPVAGFNTFTVTVLTLADLRTMSLSGVADPSDLYRFKVMDVLADTDRDTWSEMQKQLDGQLL